jgi:hypothetical protein
MKREVLLQRRLFRAANRVVRLQLAAARQARTRGEAGDLEPTFTTNWKWRHRALRGYLQIKAAPRGPRAL